MKTFYIKTYGCQMNISDSERISAFLQKTGLKKTCEAKADLLIFNTCTVRKASEDKAWGKIREIRKINKKVKIVLTGCLAKMKLPAQTMVKSCNSQNATRLRRKRNPASWSSGAWMRNAKEKIDGIDYILPIEDLTSWPKALGFKKVKTAISNDYFKITPDYHSTFQAYVPIMTGCNNFCSYCIVPYVRGGEKSRFAKEILKEIKTLVTKGYKDITLLGQNVNSYKDGKITFLKLLQLMEKIPGDFWVSFITNHPKDLSEELLEVMAASKKISPYIHLPLQSGDDKILKKMNRQYTVAQYLALVAKIRKIPDVTLATDIIVGFPGETKKQFENSLKTFKKVRFDLAFINKYSPRPNTQSSKLKDDVPWQEKKYREKVLTETLKKTSLAQNKKWLGRIAKVLVLQKLPKEKNYYLGKLQNHKLAKFQSKKNLISTFQKVRITQAKTWGLEGKLIT